MVADGAGNEVVAVGIASLHQEFGHAIACGRLLDVLAQRPPAVVVHFAEVLLRTVEKRDVPAHPFRGGRVGDCGHDVLVLHGVEVLGIVSEVVVAEYGGSGIVDRTTYHVGQGELDHTVALISTGHVEVLVGGGVDVGLVEERASAEDNP